MKFVLAVILVAVGIIAAAAVILLMFAVYVLYRVLKIASRT